ncbi:MAG: methionyl-tRNA formyltransferase [Bacteroidaceae bacterium]|nr:methionyl-tRNA formyltransferase [Bacteroidaceae bacterium]
MDKKDLRIVFMGTPEFAEFTLRRLVEDGYNIIGVVTMPDKPIGRHGSVLQSSPVKKYAVEQGIPVLQPEKLKDPAFIEQLSALKADLQIVVAFRMLPEIVWNMPRLGTFNLHGSLLPQYRGAAPINWAIINGDKETGVTTFFLKHEIDTGDIIYKESIPILPTDNAGTIHDRLMELGADLTVRTLDDIIADRVKPIPQDSIPADELRPAPKIFKETCRIDWNQPTAKVNDFIRGLSPYPAAWTVLHTSSGEDLDFKIFAAAPISCTPAQKPGTIMCDGRKSLCVATADGALKLQEVQIAGKKRMDVCAFLCGNNLSDGCFFA